jgi:DNA-binding response OmpR family regulator
VLVAFFDIKNGYDSLISTPTDSRQRKYVEWALPHRPAETAHPELPHWPEGANYAPRVLIVEDNLLYAIALMRALREKNAEFPSAQFEVDITPDPKVAVEHANKDNIDIYIVDLKFPDEKHPVEGNPDIGKELVKSILESTDAGLIVHSSVPAEESAASLLLLGADDYIEKKKDYETREVREGSVVKVEELKLQEILRAKVLALWRRIQLTRPAQFRDIAHSGRLFQIGAWRFRVGSRDLESDKSDSVRISATEHALLRYLCIVEEHEIDVETINIEILGRRSSDKQRRVDNYVYRLRSRLGASVRLISNREGAYKLMTVYELGLSAARKAR